MSDSPIVLRIKLVQIPSRKVIGQQVREGSCRHCPELKGCKGVTSVRLSARSERGAAEVGGEGIAAGWLRGCNIVFALADHLVPELEGMQVVVLGNVIREDYVFVE